MTEHGLRDWPWILIYSPLLSSSITLDKIRCLNLFAHPSFGGTNLNLEKEMAPPLQYSCLENPMDRGAW